jgi:hypothetical protein
MQLARALERGFLWHAKSEAIGWHQLDAGEEIVAVKTRLALAASMVGLALCIAGCQHYLVAAPGDTTVAIYPDRQTYDKLADLKKQGALGALASGLGKGVESKNVDDKTPVHVISSDDEGDVIEVTDGPNKGVSGFVPKNSVN